jgi:hypothetical protein
MSTLKNEDFALLNKQIENAKNKSISKEKVLLILHQKLKDVDIKNPFIIDKIDGIAIKELINSINNLD